MKRCEAIQKINLQKPPRIMAKCTKDLRKDPIIRFSE
jgi:hypothetical protein